MCMKVDFPRLSSDSKETAINDIMISQSNATKKHSITFTSVTSNLNGNFTKQRIVSVTETKIVETILSLLKE